MNLPSGVQSQVTGVTPIVIEISGDGVVSMNARSYGQPGEKNLPALREWLKNAEKETAAKKLIQDQYVDHFVDQIQQAGMRPKRDVVTTQIAGGDAQGARIRAVLDGSPGGMDSYYRVISDRFVQLSVLGSDKDIARWASAWDTVRNSLQVEPPPQPKASPQPSPAKQKP